MPLNQEEEAKFAALRKNCRELGVPAPPEIHIGFEVVDKNGVLVLQDKQRGHSWTRNWYNAMLSGVTGVTATGSTFGAGHISGKDTAGTVQGNTSRGAGCTGSGNFTSGGYVYNSDTSSTDNGIVVGTDDGAFSAEAYELGALIAHGTGTGQMSYGGQDLPTSDYDSTADNEKWTITHTRILNNNSGAAIEVKEVGLIWGTLNTTSANRFRFTGLSQYLDERSVLNPTVTVPDGAQLTVTYEISMDFSAID